MAVRKAIVLISGTFTQMPGGDTLNIGSGIVSDGSNPLLIDSGGGNVQIAANDNFVALTGTGSFDFSAASGTFKTSTGAVTVGPGATTVSGVTTFTAAGTAVTVNNDATVLGKLSATGGVGRSTAGTLQIGTDANSTAITIGAPGVTTTIAGPFALTGGLASNGVITGLTTTGIAAGDFVYLSALNTVLKSDSTAIATARMVGASEGTSGTITRNGIIPAAKFTTAGGSPAIGSAVWLAAAGDDSATGAGKLTATPPSTGVSAEVGICMDAANYASAKTCVVLLQPKAPIILS